MDFGLLPPETNSGRMYAGPGAGPMLAAAAAWDDLADQLYCTASSYESVLSGLSTEWRGPSSAAMAGAAAPYTAWMSTTAAHAENTALQAKAAAAAYETAFAATVPPPAIAANRAQLSALVATNFFGQNTPAIMATEVHYAEMWAQDAAVMYGYAGSSAAASRVGRFGSPPQTTGTGSAAATPVGGQPDPSSPLGTLLAFDSYLTGPLSPTSLYKLPAVAELLGMQGYLLPRAASGLLGALVKSSALPAAAGGELLHGGLASGVNLVRGVSTVSAGVGRAELLGGLSVPQAWSSTAPAFPMSAAASPGPATGAVAALATEGSGSTDLAMSTLAGQAMAGKGGARPSSRRPTIEVDEAEADTSHVSNIFVIPEDGE